jgi:hypothetical protein
MTKQALLDDLTETDRISALLEDVAPLDFGEMPSFPAAAPPPPGGMRRRPVGSLPLNTFLGGVNWSNAAGHQPPFHEELTGEAAGADDWDHRPLPVGAIPLRSFMGLVNWDNAADAPQAPTFTAVGCPKPEARVTVETFLTGFQWD